MKLKYFPKTAGTVVEILKEFKEVLTSLVPLHVVNNVKDIVDDFDLGKDGTLTLELNDEFISKPDFLKSIEGVSKVFSVIEETSTSKTFSILSEGTILKLALVNSEGLSENEIITTISNILQTLFLQGAISDIDKILLTYVVNENGTAVVDLEAKYILDSSLVELTIEGSNELLQSYAASEGQSSRSRLITTEDLRRYSPNYNPLTSVRVLDPSRRDCWNEYLYVLATSLLEGDLIVSDCGYLSQSEADSVLALWIEQYPDSTLVTGGYIENRFVRTMLGIFDKQGLSTSEAIRPFSRSFSDFDGVTIDESKYYIAEPDGSDSGEDIEIICDQGFDSVEETRKFIEEQCGTLPEDLFIVLGKDTLSGEDNIKTFSQNIRWMKARDLVNTSLISSASYGVKMITPSGKYEIFLYDPEVKYAYWLREELYQYDCFNIKRLEFAIKTVLAVNTLERKEQISYFEGVLGKSLDTIDFDTESITKTYSKIVTIKAHKMRKKTKAQLILFRKQRVKDLATKLKDCKDPLKKKVLHAKLEWAKAVNMEKSFSSYERLPERLSNIIAIIGYIYSYFIVIPGGKKDSKSIYTFLKKVGVDNSEDTEFIVQSVLESFESKENWMIALSSLYSIKLESISSEFESYILSKARPSTIPLFLKDLFKRLSVLSKTFSTNKLSIALRKSLNTNL